MDVQQRQLYKISSNDYTSLKETFKSDQLATAFLLSYSKDDVYVADIDGQAADLWSSTPPNTQGLYKHLVGNKTFTIYVIVNIPSATRLVSPVMRVSSSPVSPGQCHHPQCNQLYSKQPNLELMQEFGPTAFSVSSERHGQSGVNEIAQASKRSRTTILLINRWVL
ncbi:hypothetical protein LSAT2_025460 [Lamellibrachia satsuma]|nr:hypothetical protein LSAT2_025460 [Lamellibrachia satsuma]